MKIRFLVTSVTRINETYQSITLGATFDRKLADATRMFPTGGSISINIPIDALRLCPGDHFEGTFEHQI